MVPIRILHLHSTFALGGKEARAVRLMNAFGAAAHHTILSAVPDQLGARDMIARDIVVDFPQDAPSLQGLPGLARYRRLSAYMTGFDLVLTYNWGAMDGVMARRAFAPFRALPPLIHHEDGFNADETDRQKPKRVWFRRIGLPAAAALVVPSHRLEDIARRVWRQPPARIRRIPNGIAVDRYSRPLAADALPGFVRRPRDVVVGTIAGLRAVKDLPRLVRSVAALPANVRLVIVGEGPERAAILAQADRSGIADRVHLAGFHSAPEQVVGEFDILALSSLSEQFPIAVVEGMAAGLPIAAPRVGDVASMVSAENRPFIVEREPETALSGALATLAADPLLCSAIGDANRRIARTDYDERAMIAAYRKLYAGVLSTATVARVTLLRAFRATLIYACT